MRKLGILILIMAVSFAAYDPMRDLLERGDYTRLLTVARNAVIASETAINYYYLGAAYAGINREQLSERTFMIALDRPDLTYPIGLNIAAYFEEQNKPDQAINIYQRLFRRFPQEKVTTAQRMAKVLSTQKKYQESIDIFSSIIAEDPQTANPLAYYVGVGYYTLDNFEKAEEFFQKAIDANFRDPDLFLRQGELKVRRGQWQAGLDLLNSGIRLGGIIFTPEPSTFRFLGEAHAKLGDSRNAADNFRKAIQAGYREVGVYLLFAENALLNRDFQGVLEMLEPRSSAHNTNAEFQYYLGSAYDNLGMPLQAIQFYQRSLEAGYANTEIVRRRINEIRRQQSESDW
jgi:tetratricopeptide (TPR) repeat protein